MFSVEQNKNKSFNNWSQSWKSIVQSPASQLPCFLCLQHKIVCVGFISFFSFSVIYFTKHNSCKQVFKKKKRNKEWNEFSLIFSFLFQNLKIKPNQMLHCLWILFKKRMGKITQIIIILSDRVLDRTKTQ